MTPPALVCAAASSESLSEYRCLRKILQESLDAMDQALASDGLPEFYSIKAKPHPADDVDFVPSQALYKSRRNAVAALEMLKIMIKPQNEAIREDTLSHWNDVCLQLASRTSLFPTLINAGENGLSILQLGEVVGMNAKKLGKLLRLLAANFYLTEVHEDHYAVARRGLVFAHGSNLRESVKFQTWHSFTSSTKCFETWTDVKRTDSWKPIDTPAAVAFQWQEKGCNELWEFLSRFHPDKGKAFVHAMQSLPVAATVQEYDWSALPNDALIVDVGGCSGKVAITILKENPHLRAIVQDLPGVRPLALQAFRTAFPEEGMETQGRITFQDIDFFKDQPQKNADVYILRYIIHDFDDDRAAIVLQHLKEAMGPKSKLLIFDAVIHPAVISGTPAAKQLAESSKDPTLPYPLLQSSLLSNYCLLADIEMSSAVAGTERTYKQSLDLYNRVGLRVSRLIHSRATLSIIELVLP